MGATFSRLKNWTDEILTNEDLNAEIDNILNNLTASGIDDYSTNAAQMRLQTNPGAVGSESLATSLAGEVERLRFVIARLIGSDVTYWYEVPPSTITDLVAALGTGLPDNRIVSGATHTGSSQMKALIPNGAAATLALDGTPTPFIYYVNGTQYTISTDISITGLGLAPATNNTCTINSTNMSGQQSTKFAGQYGTTLVVDAMGSEITAKVGQICAFKVGATEYFTAYVKSTAELSVASRGAFFNSSGAAVPAVALSDGATITLLRLTWIFATTAGAMAVTYNNPTVSAIQPTTPATGDYWFDLTANTWKTFNSTTWVSAGATLIGVCMQDTANCVAARTFDSFRTHSDLHNIHLEVESDAVVRASGIAGELTIFGSTVKYGNSRPSWDMATMLDSGITEAASTYYYFYVKENGTPVISDIAPAHRRDLQGMYHPTNTWRCAGFAFNNGASQLIEPVTTLRSVPHPLLTMGSSAPYGGSYEESPFNFSRILQEDSGFDASGFEWTLGNGVWGDVATITVGPGIHAFTGVLLTSNDGALGAATLVNLGISSTGGDDPTGLISALNLSQAYHTTTSGERHTIIVPTYIVRVTTNTQYFLKRSAVTAHANLEYLGYRFTAVCLSPLSGMPE